MDSHFSLPLLETTSLIDFLAKPSPHLAPMAFVVTLISKVSATNPKDEFVSWIEDMVRGDNRSLR